MGLQDSICGPPPKALHGEGRLSKRRAGAAGGRRWPLQGDDGRPHLRAGRRPISPEVEGTGCLRRSFNQRPEAEGQRWFATGTSMVICHPPQNPLCAKRLTPEFTLLRSGAGLVVRRGADLTPFYPFLDDAIHFTAPEGACLEASTRAYLPGVQASGCDGVASCSAPRGNPLAFGGIFLRIPGTLQGNPSTRVRNPQFCGRTLSVRCRPQTQSWEQLFLFGQRLRPRFLPSYRADRTKKRNPLAYGERETPVQLYLPRPLCGIQSRASDRGTIFGSADQRRPIDPDVAAASGALGSTATRRSRQPAGLAHRIVFTCPQRPWLQGRITEGSLPTPSQAVG